MSTEPLVGQYIGKYRVERELGRGGMGAVYELVHQEIGHRAAIKVLGGKVAADPTKRQLVDRFLAEARAVNLIDHPGVVRIFDFGELGNRTVYIMMELLVGTTLGQRMEQIQKGRAPGMPLGEVLRIGRQVAATMACAHEKQILHRDLKPENLMIIADPEAPGKERVKILDFGLAKFLDSAERRTAAGITLGTPMYMSPEQCMGGDKIDGKTDVYSLGIMLYEMVTGTPPFIGENVSMMRAHLNEQPRPLNEVVPALPMAIAGLVHEMLRKDPAERPTMAKVEARIAEIERSGIAGTSVISSETPVEGGDRSGFANTMAAPSVPMDLVRKSTVKASALRRALLGRWKQPALIALPVIALGLGGLIGARFFAGEAACPPQGVQPPASAPPASADPKPQGTPPAVAETSVPAVAERAHANPGGKRKKRTRRHR